MNFQFINTIIKISYKIDLRQFRFLIIQMIILKFLFNHQYNLENNQDYQN